MSIEQVQEFHQKFGLPDGFDESHFPSDETIAFRSLFLKEELLEFVSSCDQQDLVGAFDALLDLCYVAYGTALKMGIAPEQWNDGMHEVHSANMTKVRATSESDSKRGSTLDVVKPPGFVPPEKYLTQILDGTYAGRRNK